MVYYNNSILEEDDEENSILDHYTSLPGNINSLMRLDSREELNVVGDEMIQEIVMDEGPADEKVSISRNELLVLLGKIHPANYDFDELDIFDLLFEVLIIQDFTRGSHNFSQNECIDVLTTIRNIHILLKNTPGIPAYVHPALPNEITFGSNISIRLFEEDRDVTGKNSTEEFHLPNDNDEDGDESFNSIKPSDRQHERARSITEALRLAYSSPQEGNTITLHPSISNIHEDNNNNNNSQNQNFATSSDNLHLMFRNSYFHARDYKMNQCVLLTREPQIGIDLNGIKKSFTSQYPFKHRKCILDLYSKLSTASSSHHYEYSSLKQQTIETMNCKVFDIIESISVLKDQTTSNDVSFFNLNMHLKFLKSSMQLIGVNFDMVPKRLSNIPTINVPSLTCLPKVIHDIFEAISSEQQHTFNYVSKDLPTVARHKLDQMFPAVAEAKNKYFIQDVTTTKSFKWFLIKSDCKFLRNLQSIGMPSDSISKVVETLFAIVNLLLLDIEPDQQHDEMSTYESLDYKKLEAMCHLNKSDIIVLIKASQLLGLDVNDMLAIFEPANIWKIEENEITTTSSEVDFQPQVAQSIRDEFVAVIYEALCIYLLKEINRAFYKNETNSFEERRGADDVVSIDLLEIPSMVTASENNGRAINPLNSLLSVYFNFSIRKTVTEFYRVESNNILKYLVHNCGNSFDSLEELPANNDGILGYLSGLLNEMGESHVEYDFDEFILPLLESSPDVVAEYSMQEIQSQNKYPPWFLEKFLPRRMRFADETSSLFFIDLVRLYIGENLSGHTYMHQDIPRHRATTLPKSLTIKGSCLNTIQNVMNYTERVQRLISENKTWVTYGMNMDVGKHLVGNNVSSLYLNFSLYDIDRLLHMPSIRYSTKFSIIEFKDSFLKSKNLVKSEEVFELSGSSLSSRIKKYIESITADGRCKTVDYCITKKYLYVHEDLRKCIEQDSKLINRLYERAQLNQGRAYGLEKLTRSMSTLVRKYSMSISSALPAPISDADIKPTPRTFERIDESPVSNEANFYVNIDPISKTTAHAQGSKVPEETTDNGPHFRGDGWEKLQRGRSPFRFFFLAFWKFFMGLATVFIPGWFLKRYFGRKSELTQRLWRERLVIFLIMSIANCFFMFWIIGLKRLTCKHDPGSFVKDILNPRKLGAKEEMAYMYGNFYNVKTINKIHTLLHGIDIQDTSGKDISTLFRRDEDWQQYCGGLQRPVSFSLYPSIDSAHSQNYNRSSASHASIYSTVNWGYVHSNSSDREMNKYLVSYILWNNDTINDRLDVFEIESGWKGAIFHYNKEVYDISSLRNPGYTNISLFPEPLNSYLVNGTWDPNGADLTSYFKNFLKENPTGYANSMTCLHGLFQIGYLPRAKSPMCTVPNILVCIYTGILLLPLFTRLVLSLIRYVQSRSPELNRKNLELQWANDKRYFGISDKNSYASFHQDIAHEAVDFGRQTSIKEYRKSLDVMKQLGNHGDENGAPLVGPTVSNVIILLQFYNDTRGQVFEALDGIYTQILASNEKCILIVVCDGSFYHRGEKVSSADFVREYFAIDRDDTNEFLYDSKTHPVYKWNQIVIQSHPAATRHVNKIPLLLMNKRGWLNDKDFGARGVRDTHDIILGFLFKYHSFRENNTAYEDFTDMDKAIANGLSCGPCAIEDYEYIFMADSRFVLQPYAISEMAKHLSQKENVMAVTGTVKVSHLNLLHLWDLYSSYYLDKLFESSNGEITNLESGFSMLRLYEKGSVLSTTYPDRDKSDSVELQPVHVFGASKLDKMLTKIDDIDEDPKLDFDFSLDSISTGMESNHRWVTPYRCYSRVALHPGFLNDYLRQDQGTLHWKILLNSKYSGYMTTALLRRFPRSRTEIAVGAESVFNESLAFNVVLQRQTRYFNCLIHNFIELTMNYPAGPWIKLIRKFPVHSRMVLRMLSPTIVICTYYLICDLIIDNDNMNITYPFLMLICAFIVLYSLIMALQRQWRIVVAFTIHTALLCPVFMVFFPVWSWFAIGNTQDSHDLAFR